jgi:hypothetical protein
MKCEARLVLNVDPIISSVPQAQGLIEMIMQGTSDLLLEAKDGPDFKEQLLIRCKPWEEDLGKLEISVLDQYGRPADLAYDDTIVIQVLATSIH